MPQEKKGWYWEDVLIEEGIPQEHFSVSIDDSFTNVNNLVVLGPGFIHLDMKMWGEADLSEYPGNLSVTGIYPGIYEIYVAYFEDNGNVGQVVRAHEIDGEVAELHVPKDAGPQVLKMNAYIFPFTEQYEYIFNDKAQGVNIYIKFIEAFELNTPTDDLLHICEINFEKGWKKVGDAVGSAFQSIGHYNSFVEISGTEDFAPGIVSFTGGVGTTAGPFDSWSPFEFYSQPLMTFYSSHGYHHDGLDKYRFKTAIVHKKRSYIGNVAKIKTLLDDEGLPQDNWGSIFEVNGDRIYKSAARVYDNYPDSNWIDIVSSDGDEVIALQRFGDLIFQFKKNKTYIVSTGGGVETLVDTLNMGISHSTCCCVTPHGVCFFNKKGVYLHTGEGFVNLSKDKLDIEKYWYNDISEYFDIDYFIPALVYSPLDDRIVLFLQTFGEGDTLEYLRENPEELISILGLPDNTDTGIGSGIGVDYEHILEALDLMGARTTVVLNYSFPAGCWTTGGDSFHLGDSGGSYDLLSGHKSNPVEYKGNIYVYNVSQNSLVKWNNTPRSQRIDIQTKFNTFQYPSIRKKIKSIALTWKFDKEGDASFDPIVEIRLYKNKSDTKVALTASEAISGAEFETINGLPFMKLSSGDNADTGVNTYITKIKMPKNDSIVYSLSIRLKTLFEETVGLDSQTKASFELLDISVVHQYMGAK
jgi:hypothetical protein